jgi:hypothetical protein
MFRTMKRLQCAYLDDLTQSASPPPTQRHCCYLTVGMLKDNLAAINNQELAHVMKTPAGPRLASWNTNG